MKYYTDDGEILGSINIVSDNNVEHASLKNQIKMIFAD